jgi:hypothetical protein
MLDILQQMHIDGEIKRLQKHGILICPSITTKASRPDGYRALTLLNADLKIMKRIIAQRLGQWLPELIHPSQHCVVCGKPILDAVAMVRNAIAFAEITKKSYASYQ